MGKQHKGQPQLPCWYAFFVLCLVLALAFQNGFCSSHQPYQRGQTKQAVCATKDSCTSPMVFGENIGDSDTRQSTTVLALTTLGNTIQIGSFLFTSCPPRWPRKVRKMLYMYGMWCNITHDIAGIITLNFANVNTA